MFQPLDVFENACHRVVVSGGNGVELMVVTAGASDCLGQQTLSYGVKLFINVIHVELALVLVLEERVTHQQVGRGDEIPTLGVD